MEKAIWHSQYEEGIPIEVDVKAYNSLNEIFDESCVRHAKRRACSNMGHGYTFAEWARYSAQLASFLQNRGIGKGDRVAVMMPNILQYPVALFAILRAGATVVSVNPLSVERELVHQLKDSGARAIVIFEGAAHTLEKTLKNSEIEQVIVARLGDLFPRPKAILLNTAAKHIKKIVPKWNIPNAVMFRNALAEGAKVKNFEKPDISLEDLAFLQYTGGTTGTPKGVMLSHGNVVANVLQVMPWLETEKPKDGRHVVVTALPLYHIFALTANCITFMFLGGESVLITNPRDFPAFVAAIKNLQFTVITGVNTLFNGLLNEPDFAQVDFSNICWACGGGTAVQESIAKRWHEVTGHPINQAYGLSETSPAVTINPLSQKTFTGSIGVPIVNTEVSIRDREGKEVALGELGELCVRGPQVMQGYWKKPEATKEAFFEDGWFRTGDIGHCDENGYFYISDRLKDMILVSGFNVYPNEVEAVLSEHPSIIESAVIGVPDGATGEAVKAFVVSNDSTLSIDNVIEHCRNGLTAYKVPKLVEFCAEIPKSPVGKLLRRELRDTPAQ